MIIGISGKIGSGKDTVGHIIRNLIWFKEAASIDYEEMTDVTFTLHQLRKLKTNDLIPHEDNYSWQIKKYAYKLKQITSILTGIPVEDLEKEEVKNSKLGEEWIRYGYANGFKHIYHNGLEKETVMNNKQCSKEKYEEEFRVNWQTAYKQHLSYRELLQYLGTDLLRNQLHENVWVNALFSKYKSIQQTTISKDCPRQGVYEVSEADELQYGRIETIYPNWIITDMRFPNELKAVKDRGGISIRVNRPKKYNTGNKITNIILEQTKDFGKVEHPSEIALDDYNFDYTIDNNGNIEELIEKVKVILYTKNIIKL